MNEDSSPIIFREDDYYPPQATISLPETNLLTPNSPPESSCSVKEEEEELEKRPTKKRKSWGQELPTPKTNLPPRKRAKTDDEKEQRRIERVLRNRQAAQSSRERKRQEVEKLEGEKCAIEQQNRLLKERLLAVEHEKFKLAQQVARMAAEMSAFKSQRRSRGSIAPSSPRSSCTPSPSFEPEFLHQQIVKQELQDLEQYQFLPTPDHSVDPSTTSFSSPASSSYSRSPSPSELGLGFHANAVSSDMAQHPAVSIRGGDMASFESEQGPTAPTTNLFNPTSLSDADLGSLFSSTSSPEPDFQFFADGLPCIEQEPSQDIATDFSFDQLVDFDACQSHSDDFTRENNEPNDDDQTRQSSSFLTPLSDSESTDYPNQTAVTSSALQPCLGASS